ncbi:methionine/alanine import family NSS transporter small subunit [Nocardiopsis sp. NRRL B-16309]|nr:methionine/alanine import family NSS transporter small subunit [Nocardiopsis sp. NRRL B-16309]
MSFGAIVMMIVFIIVLWGGLLAAVLNLRAHPEDSDQE